jgi:hypothetical protein
MIREKRDFREEPFGLRTRLQLRVCQPPSTIASLNQDSWKFRVSGES